MRTMTLGSLLLCGCLGCATPHTAQPTENAGGPQPKLSARDELASATRAEDEAVKALDTALKARERTEVVAPLMNELEQRIRETDALVNQVFTPEIIDAMPWTDLLIGAQRTRWQHAGFADWHIDDDGTLAAVNAAGNSNVSGIMSIGDVEQWRDYVLDVEFTLIQGESWFHFRLGPAVNDSTLSMNVSTSHPPPFKAGVSNQMTVSLLGSAWKFVFADPDYPPHEEDEVPWEMRRKGAIAVSVPPGSALRITRMRIKVLR